MQSLDEFHTGVRQSQVQAQVSRVFFEPHVLVLCLCLLLWDFTWILLPSMACQWHTQAPLCASWVSALILSNFTILSQEAGGQLQGCVKNGWEMILKAITLKSNIVTSLLNVDRALTHVEGMMDTHCLRF